MSEFVFLYRGQRPQGSPEQMQQVMQKWLVWMKELGASGNLKSAGLPLEKSGKLVTGSSKKIVDGPYAEAKDIVGGFTIVEAKDIMHATELAKGCPGLEAGIDVEVRPAMSM